MKMKRFVKTFTLILCIVLIAVTALFANGCAREPLPEGKPKNVQKLGEGETQFYFVVTDKDGNSKGYDIKTSKTVVGDALLELELIAGDEGQFGLYVKTVDGITADYDVDGTYWAFYENGQYAQAGVDTTEIVAGTIYTFKVEK